MYRAQLLLPLTTLATLRQVYFEWNHATDELFDGMNLLDPEKAKAIFPFVYWAGVAWCAISTLLVLLAFKWPTLTKSYLYWLSVGRAIHYLHPLPYTYNLVLAYETILIWIELTMCYFHWGPATLTIFANYAWIHCSRNFYNGEQLLGVEFQTQVVPALVAMTFILWVFHLLVSHFGKLYVESEVRLRGQYQLCDDLDNGVLILNDQTFELLYHNQKAAQTLQLDVNLCETEQAAKSAVVGAGCLENLNTPLLARVDPDIFACVSDLSVAQRKERLEAVDCYLTLSEVVKEHMRKDAPQKSVYKLKEL